MVECVRSMLHQKSLPLEFWGEAVHTAVYVLNRISSRTLHGETPFTKWYGYKPDVSHFKEFGSVCYAHVPKQVRKKLDSKAQECLFLGYCTTSKAYRLWSVRKRKVLHSRDVIFDEETAPGLVLSTTGRHSPPDYSLLFPAELHASFVPMTPVSSSSVNSESTSVGVDSTEAASSLQVSSPLSIQESVGGSVQESVGGSLSFFNQMSPRSSDTSCLPDSFSPGISATSSRSSPLVAMSPSESSGRLNPILRTRPLSELYQDNSTADSQRTPVSGSFVATANTSHLSE